MANPGAFAWASWDGEFVLFHRLSGHTHLLNSAAHRLLTQVLLAPEDMGAIVAALGSHWSEAEREGNLQETRELLWRLEELGLVQAA